MVFRVAWTVVVGSVCLAVCAIAQSKCPVNVLIVKGRVDHVPRNASVRVQLMYSKGQRGETAETTIENRTFSIPIEFLTQSRRPVVNGLFEKCDRKPTSVVVVLVATGSDQEYDRVSLSLARDFTMADASAYALRSEIVLNGPS
jgi:hypothetical protein